MSWFQPPYLALWTFAVAATCGGACAMLGCFLVLRRMSLIGDGISHGVLPGLFVGYLLGGATNPAILFAGAVLFGLLTAVLTQTLHEYGGVNEDASLGVVFTSLFALGVVLISKFASRLHIDADCVLYGLLDYAALDTRPLFGFEVPRTLFILVPALVLVLGFTLLLWKELKISSFDEQLATTMGYPAPVLHYALMAMVSLVTVASFEAVGSILVVAMLIVPAATAQMLTDRLRTMLVVAAAVGVLSALFGVLFSQWFDVNAAGSMAVVVGGLFGLAVVFAPRHGVVGKAVVNLGLSLRIASEDVVGTLFRREEQAGGRVPIPRDEAIRVAGEGLVGRWAIARLRRAGHVEVASDGTLSLTPRGHAFGQEIVRAHRLWETYLEQHFELDADHLHAPAERIEHYIGPELRERMADELAAPATDPHGRDIPAAE